jgi:hypothetical protein
MILGFSGYLIFGQDVVLCIGGITFNSVLRFDHWARI